MGCDGIRKPRETDIVLRFEIILFALCLCFAANLLANSFLKINYIRGLIGKRKIRIINQLGCSLDLDNAV